MRRLFIQTACANPVGLAYEPVSGKLWTVVNERDMLGSDMVPDYLTEVLFCFPLWLAMAFLARAC